MVLLRGATEDEATGAVRFQQNSAFFYLTGVAAPGALLVLLPDSVPANAGQRDLDPQVREILFLPARNPTVETWSGPKLGPGTEAEALTGIAKVMEAGGLWGALTGWIRRCSLVSTPAPDGNNAPTTREYALMQEILRQAPVVQFRDCALPLARQRAIKSPAEIERILEAIAITTEGHHAARQVIAEGAGRREFEVEAEVYAMFRSQGATLAFAPIIGAGRNGTILHYEDNRDTLQEGDLVVVDIGAKIGGYCGDLTRTYPVGGVFSPRQREIYALVLDAHERAVSGYQPGVDTLKSLSDRCKEFLKDSPLRARDNAGVEQTMNVFMPHGLTHHLGLDVHDAGDALLPLAPGNVITIEPGVYLPSEGIGVRIEDDYLVTANGLERLGPPLERTIAELEEVMR
jgi:Xaa-Pro aminopeptidase